MGKNIVEKILAGHLVSGTLVPGGEIGIRIDQTLTQDATGTMAYLQFEAIKVDRVQTELSVSYIDHNTIQIGFENADDHRYLHSVAQKFGVVLSRAGNGICHQVHLERFGKPGIICSPMVSMPNAPILAQAAMQSSRVILRKKYSSWKLYRLTPRLI